MSDLLTPDLVPPTAFLQSELYREPTWHECSEGPTPPASRSQVKRSMDLPKKGSKRSRLLVEWGKSMSAQKMCVG